MSKSIIIGCMILGLLVFAQSGGAQTTYDYELAYGYSNQDSGYRNAVDVDDWLERGHASVTASPVFSEGIRLTAWASNGGETYEPGLASAIYHFAVPRWARYLKITVRYKDITRNDQIAGRLWIKSTERGTEGPSEVEGEVPLYGDTFVLRSDRISETIMVPSSRHVEAGSMEMHIVAEGQECLDVQYVRVEYLETTPDSITIVHRAYNNYWDQWPRYRYVYHYYYWGPLYWPRTYVTYECWDVPQRFYWVTWRPWFHLFIGGFWSHPWWEPRRYTVIYHDDTKHSPIERRRLIHQRLRERHEHTTHMTHATPVIREGVRSSVQTRPPQHEEIRSAKEINGPGTFEIKVNQNQTPKHLQEQPIRGDNQREKPMVNTPTNMVESHQVVNKPDVRTARPSYTAPQHKQNDQPQPQPRTVVAQTSRPTSMAQEAVQAPARVQKTQDDGAKQEYAVQRPANMGQKTMPQSHQEIKQPRLRGDEKGPQSRTVAQTSRPGSMAQEAVQAPARVHKTQDDGAKQKQAVQRPANRGQKTMPQSHQEIKQPRSHGEEKRPLIDHKQPLQTGTPR